MPYILQNLVLEEWTILDTNSNPLSGMTSPADITFTLHRQSGSTFVAATEVITFAAIAGSPGHYYISFTPQNAGLYILQLKELNVNTLQRTWRFSYEVLTAGSVFTPTFSNAYCAETDVERYSGLSFTASSQVTSSQVAGFAEERATVLSTLVSRWGLTISPSSGVVPGSRLEDLLRAANAIGAALDAVIAWEQQIDPSKSERAARMLEQWVAYVGGDEEGILEGFLQTEVESSVSLATSHILSGDTTARENENAPQDIGLQVRMGDVY